MGTQFQPSKNVRDQKPAAPRARIDRPDPHPPRPFQESFRGLIAEHLGPLAGGHHKPALGPGDRAAPLFAQGGMLRFVGPVAGIHGESSLKRALDPQTHRTLRFLTSLRASPDGACA